jgi:hypothetical protein
MKTILLTLLGLSTIGLIDLNAQLKEIHLGDTLVVIERLTLSDADDKKVDRIRSAQADKKVSDSWRVDDLRTKDRRLEKDYDKIAKGLKEKGIKFKELNRQEFKEYLNSETDNKVFYLTNNYSVREEKNFLIITMTFQLLSTDKAILLDDAAKGILKQISGK